MSAPAGEADSKKQPAGPPGNRRLFAAPRETGEFPTDFPIKFQSRFSPLTGPDFRYTCYSNKR